MTREPWMQPAEERGSFRRTSVADRRLSIVSGSFPMRAGSKIELQGSGRALQQIQEQKPEQQAPAPRPQPCETPASNPIAPKLSTASRRGSMLGSLKAYYRKLRTFKGTVRALIHLKRTLYRFWATSKPLSLRSAMNSEGKAVLDSHQIIADDGVLYSVALEVPRISATAVSTVQTKVQKLVEEGYEHLSVLGMREILSLISIMHELQTCCRRDRLDVRSGGHLSPARQPGPLHRGI